MNPKLLVTISLENLQGTCSKKSYVLLKVLFIYLYIYIYIEREREREREQGFCPIGLPKHKKILNRKPITN